MKSILTVLLLASTLAAFSQVPIPKKGGTSANPAPTLGDTTITIKIVSKVSFDTTKVVVELLGDDGSDYLTPIYKRGYVIRKLLTPSNEQQPRIEWQKLFDDKWAPLNYAPNEAKGITPFEWKAKK